MDNGNLMKLLEATLDPGTTDDALKQLEARRSDPMFASRLLQISMNKAVDMESRKASTVYLKNIMRDQWPLISLEEKQDIRNCIIDCVITAPTPLGKLLTELVAIVLTTDYPGEWPTFDTKIQQYLSSSSDANKWTGSLSCLYALIKKYEYARGAARIPMLIVMKTLLPTLLTLLTNISQHPASADNHTLLLLVQKKILKIFFRIVNYALPLNLITMETFKQWLAAFIMILGRPTECETNSVILWAQKKWITKILVRMIQRYGDPGDTISAEYEEFAEQYVQQLSTFTLTALFKLLNEFHLGVKVHPQVMSNILSYLKISVKQSTSWLVMKPLVGGPIIHDVILRLMSHTEADAKLWAENGHEYVRQKYCTVDDAPGELLYALCSRRGVLDDVVAQVMLILRNPDATFGELHGATRMMGSVASRLLSKTKWKIQLEYVISQDVLPNVKSEAGHLRSVTFWLLHVFSGAAIMNTQNLEIIASSTISAITTDPDFPVKFTAAVCSQMYTLSQPDFRPFLASQAVGVFSELLAMSRDVNNPDIVSVMQTIARFFTPDLEPFIQEICLRLANSFVLQTDDKRAYSREMAHGTFTVLKTVLSISLKEGSSSDNLQPIMYQLSEYILKQQLDEFYEDAVANLIERSVGCPYEIPASMLQQLPQCQPGLSLLSALIQQYANNHCFEGVADRKLWVLVTCSLLAVKEERQNVPIALEGTTLPAFIDIMYDMKALRLAASEDTESQSEEEAEDEKMEEDTDQESGSDEEEEPEEDSDEAFIEMEDDVELKLLTEALSAPWMDSLRKRLSPQQELKLQFVLQSAEN